MKKRSIRFKVNAAIICAGLFTVLVCNLIIYPFELRHREAQWEGMQLLLRSVMEQKQEDLANEIFAGQERALAESIREIKKIEGISAIRIFDTAGFELRLNPETGLQRDPTTAKLPNIKDKSAFTRETLQDQAVAAYLVPIEAMGERVGYAKVYYDLQSLEFQRYLNMMLALAVSLAIMGVLAAVLNPLLSRLVIRPVIALRAAMKQAQDGSLGQQLTITSGDEIGEVATAFNDMSRELERQQIELANWNAKLEQVVQERTQSLQKLYERLQEENRERRTIQEALEQSEAKLSSIVQVAPIGIGLMSEGVLSQVNDYLCRMLGLATTELQGKDLSDLIVKDQQWAGTFQHDAIHTRLNEGREVTLKRKDGSRISALIRATCLDPAEPKAGVTFIAMDITERKQAEKALLESEERLRAIFNNAGIGIAVTDRSGKFIQANATMADMLGYPTDQLLHLNLLEITHPEDQPACSEYFAEVFQGDRLLYRCEKRYLRADGTVLWGDITATPIRDPSGQVQEVIQTVLDISKKKRFEQDLLRSEKLESIAGLASGIAHDFNNILTAIVGNVGLARLTLNDHERALARLEAAEKACLRAQSLSKQLLTFSKGGAPVKETSAISDIIRESVKFSLTGSNVACTYDLPDNLWPIDADKDQISQVFNNIVLNSVQAMPDGGNLRIRAQNIQIEESHDLPLEPGRYVRVSISDQGVGIDPTQLDKIFDPFFTTKKNGSGLGLAAAHSITRKHNGHISVESEIGSGTMFHLYLPASSRPDSELPTAAIASANNSEGCRILIMDDEDIILDISGEILRHLGYQVTTAKDGAEAIDRYQQAMASGIPFDAVIMDLTIPGGMGGKEAIGEIRRLDSNARAVVSSGYSNDPVMANFRDYGFDAVAVKPYKIAELSRVLGELLNESGA